MGQVEQACQSYGINPAILQQYPINIYKITAIERQCWNYHFRIESSIGVLCLKKYRGNLKEADVQYWHELIFHLNEMNDKLFVVPIRTNKGATYCTDNQNYYFMSHWIDGISDDNQTDVNTQKIQNAAHVLARIHQYLEDFNPKIYRTSPLDPCLMDILTWQKKSDEILGQVKWQIENKLSGFQEDDMNDFNYIVEQKYKIYKTIYQEGYLTLYDHCRQSYVFGEFRPANIAFKENSVSCVLDYDCSIKDIRLYDLCFSAAAFSGKEDFSGIHDIDRLILFLRYYHDKNPLSKIETYAFPWFLRHMIIKWISASWRRWQLKERLTFYKQVDEYFNGQNIFTVRLNI